MPRTVALPKGSTLRHGACCTRAGTRRFTQKTEVEPISGRGRGQGLIEYGLIIALVAILAIAAIVVFGPAMGSLLSRLGGSV